MSSALVRQALEFVDPNETCGKRKKRGADRPRGAPGQDSNKVPRNCKSSKSSNSQVGTPNKQVAEEVIARLLKLSKPSLDKKTAKKIVKRAASGKPVADIAQPRAEEPKSILFPDEPAPRRKRAGRR